MYFPSHLLAEDKVVFGDLFDGHDLSLAAEQKRPITHRIHLQSALTISLSE